MVRRRRGAVAMSLPFELACVNDQHLRHRPSSIGVPHSGKNPSLSWELVKTQKLRVSPAIPSLAPCHQPPSFSRIDVERVCLRWLPSFLATTSSDDGRVTTIHLRRRRQEHSIPPLTFSAFPSSCLGTRICTSQARGRERCNRDTVVRWRWRRAMILLKLLVKSIHSAAAVMVMATTVRI